jgi:Undecaprenyl-phosphate glucose phosphotransferase
MSSFLKAFFFLFDVIVLNVSIVFSFYLSDNLFLSSSKESFIYLTIYSNLSWLFLTMVSAPYSIANGWPVLKILKNHLAFFLIHSVIIASLVIFFNRHYSAYQIVLLYTLFSALFFIYRLIFFLFQKLVSPEIAHRNFLIIGRNSLGIRVREFYLMHPELRYKFKGYVDFDGVSISFPDIDRLHNSEVIHEIFCCAPSITNSDLHQLIDFGLNSLIKVKIIREVNPTAGQTIQLQKFDQRPGIDIPIVHVDEPFNRILKRGFDICFAGFVTLSILSWLVPIIGILIKLDSKGPVFFIQQRKGRRNVSFGCIKFRTMRQNNEADSKQISKSDSRVTRFGSFLRRSSLDEVPQFFNVLLGDMSVVGPRPQMPAHYDQYSGVVEDFMSRHYVKSGITGLAQCMGYRGEIRDITDMENRIRLDRYYIENWSFWLDIKIVFLTVISLIRGSDKAY